MPLENLRINLRIEINRLIAAALASIVINTGSYVLSEHKQLGKKLDACQYIGSVHLILKWQQPNISAAVCVINVNLTTKDKDNITNFDVNIPVTSLAHRGTAPHRHFDFFIVIKII